MCAIKLDMSKAYNRLEWLFLCRVMRKMGFDEDWVDQIFRCISTTQLSFIINGKQRGSLSPSRGLRQGDPISPYLFLICTDAFSGLLSKAQKGGPIHGVKVCKRAPQVSHLFFADDSVLFVRATTSECERVIDIIRRYEEASGQRINSEKSEVVFSRNEGADLRQNLLTLLQMKEVDYHAKYLGLPTILSRSKKAVFAGIKERVWKKLRGYKEKLLSSPGKEIILKAVAQAIPSYAMSIFKLPETLLDELHAILAKFWWGSSDQKRKIHWKKWEDLCRPKMMGGMGFRDL